MTRLLNITNSQWNIWLNIAMLAAVVIIGIFALRYMKEYTGIRRYVELFAMIRSVESSPKAIIVTDADGLIIFWNKGAENVIGYKAAKIKGKSVTDIIAPAYRDVVIKGLASLREGEDAGLIGKAPLETVCLHALGVEFPAEITIWRHVNDQDTFFGGLIRNITAQKEREELRRKEAERLGGIIDMYVKGEMLAPAAFWMWDRIADKLLCSPGMMQVYGLDSNYVPAPMIRDRIYFEDIGKVRHALDGMSETKQGYSELKYRIPQRDGRLQWVESTCATEIDANGTVIKVYGFLKILKDVS